MIKPVEEAKSPVFIRNFAKIAREIRESNYVDPKVVEKRKELFKNK